MQADDQERCNPRHISSRKLLEKFSPSPTLMLWHRHSSVYCIQSTEKYQCKGTKWKSGINIYGWKNTNYLCNQWTFAMDLQTTCYWIYTNGNRNWKITPGIYVTMLTSKKAAHISVQSPKQISPIFYSEKLKENVFQKHTGSKRKKPNLFYLHFW